MDHIVLDLNNNLKNDSNLVYTSIMTEIEKDLWNRVNRYVPWLRFVPFIRMVAVCNNLSFGKVKLDSDIDLFIVARKDRLFTVRILVTLFFQIFGVRRYAGKEAGRFCLSFFIDDSVMDFKSIAISNDIYLAFWISNLKIIVDDGCSYEFLSSNSWINRYFESKVVLDENHKRYKPKSILNFLFPKSFENFMKKWQLKRARQKSKSVGFESSLILTSHMLKFHNLDRRAYYRDKWMKKFADKKLNIQDFSSL